jgi:hypothetical protein
MNPNAPVGQNSNNNTEISLIPENHAERRKWNFRNFSLDGFFKHRILGSSYGEMVAWLFCACAIIANIISIILHFTIDYLGNSPSAKAAALLWVASILLAGTSAILFSKPVQKTKKIKSMKRFLIKRLREIFSSSLQSIKTFFSNLTFWSLPHILILAFIVRIIPILKNGLYLDEWYWLETAKRILAGIVSSPFGFVGDQPANLTAFPVALVLALSKNPVLSVRLTGVIYSLITITFLYLLFEKILGKKAAVVGSLLFAISVWDIHMSNLGWNNVNINPLLVSGVLYFLYKIYTNNYSIRALFALAFLLAICVHLLYVAALLIIPALLTLLILAIYWLRNKSGPKLREYILFSIFFVICLSPLLPKVYKYPQESIGRHSDFIQQNINLSGESKSPAAYYFDQMKLLADDFSLGARNFHLEGLWGITLDPAIQVLSILGVLLAIIQVIRKKSTSFWLIIIVSLCTLLLIPFILLYRTTSLWRSYAVLPIVYLLATFSIVQISKFEKFLTQKYLHKKKGVLNFFLAVNAVLYLIISSNWFISYFDTYLTKSTGYETSICQYAALLIDKNIPTGSTVYMPDEMCSPLIASQYEESQYHFVPITPDGPTQIVSAGSYLVLLNSQRYGYFNESIQKKAEQIAVERNAVLISDPSCTQPVLYFLK